MTLLCMSLDHCSSCGLGTPSQVGGALFGCLQLYTNPRNHHCHNLDLRHGELHRRGLGTGRRRVGACKGTLTDTFALGNPIAEAGRGKGGS